MVTTTMFKLLTLIALAIYPSCTASSQALIERQQSDTGSGINSGFQTRNLVYLELMGNAFLYSVNYERFITNNITVRLGFQELSGFQTLAFPLMINFIGKSGGDNHLELGCGVVFIREWKGGNVYRITFRREKTLLKTLSIGFRHQPAQGGFMYRLTATPIFEEAEAPSFSLSSTGSNVSSFLMWFGISLGYSF